VYETSLREALTTALAQQGGAPADLPASPSAALASMRHRLQGLRVLLVDDQEFNRFVGTELLQSVGFAVDTAEDGLQAVHQVQRAAYDVVLMDMQMPVMDGIRATQEIRKLHALDGLPILAMTANAMQHDKDACLAAGMVAVVTKPIVPDELWEALTRWVRPRRQAVAVTAPTALARQSATHAPAPPPVQVSALPQVPGLDMAGALRRIQHDTVFYRKLLAMYLRGQGGVQQDMQRAIEAQDWLQAERLAHSNKGVSASIGATAVQNSADQLEVALRQRQPVAQILSLVAAWEATLRVLLEQLEQTLAAPWVSSDDPTQAGASTISEPLPLLVRLLDLLQAGESDALGLWESDKERLRSTLGDAFESIDDAIRAFEFEVAAAAMQRQIDQKLAHT
jgi:two-component system sensor histidine kinase/response regulator